MNNIVIEVAYALAEKQSLVQLKVPADTTVQQAIDASGILIEHPTINLQDQTVGIWSKPCNLETKLKPGDRVEIYRPIQADAKKARLSRANNS